MAILSPETIEYNQCEEAVRRLTDYLTHELKSEDEATVQQHLRQCKGCMAKFHFEEQLLKTIRERAQEIQAPETLRSRILSLLQEPPRADIHSSVSLPGG